MLKNVLNVIYLSFINENLLGKISLYFMHGFISGLNKRRVQPSCSSTQLYFLVYLEFFQE